MKKETLKENWEKEFEERFIKNRDFYLYDPEEERYKVLSFIRQLLASQKQELLEKIEGEIKNCKKFGMRFGKLSAWIYLKEEIDKIVDKYGGNN